MSTEECYQISRLRQKESATDGHRYTRMAGCDLLQDAGGAFAIFAGYVVMREHAHVGWINAVCEHAGGFEFAAEFGASYA